jgi:hypothetical protein
MTITSNLGCTTHPKSDLIEAGQQAWSRLKSRSTWADWKALGVAAIEGRTEAMARARTNEPKGRRYNTEFGTWLAEHDFGDLEATTRKRLLQCMENIAAIDTWLTGLNNGKQLRLNHPATVLSAWKRATAKPNEPDQDVAADAAPLLSAWQAASVAERRKVLTTIIIPDLLELLSKEQIAVLQRLARANDKAKKNLKKYSSPKGRNKQQPPFLELAANRIS